jgi:hypothetical protein
MTFADPDASLETFRTFQAARFRLLEKSLFVARPCPCAKRYSWLFFRLCPSPALGLGCLADFECIY